jgi:hypothetical protein
MIKGSKWPRGPPFSSTQGGYITTLFIFQIF